MLHRVTLFALCAGIGLVANAEDPGRFDGMIVACEQARPAYVIVDPKADWADPAAVVWEWSPADSSDIQRWEGAWFGNPSDVKPVLDGTHLLVCASGGGVGLIRIEDKRMMWYAKAGGNTHSIEILPDGNIVSASSKGYLAVFDRSKPLDDPRKPNPEKIELYSAHGVVWDAQRERLWAIGADTLKRYRYVTDSGPPTLAEEASFELPGFGGHDLFPVTGEERLYLTVNGGAWTFDLADEEFAQCLAIGGVKSLCRKGAEDSLMFVKATEVWWSDEIRFPEKKDVKTLPGARFYKARWMAPNPFSYSPRP